MAAFDNPVFNKTLTPVAGAGPNFRATYYTSVTEFTHVCPRSLIDGERLGTSVGKVADPPRFTVDDRTVDMFSHDHGAWPMRMEHWPGTSAERRRDKNALRFHEFHVYDIIEAHETAQSCSAWLHPRFMETLRPSGTVVTLLGMSACGKRVAVHVYGQQPYFYAKKSEIDASIGISTPGELAHAMAASLRSAASRRSTFVEATAESFVIDVVQRRDIYYYESREEEYYRVKSCSAKYISFLCDNFCRGVKKYEGGIDATTRFAVDNELFTFGWYRFKPCAGAIQIRDVTRHSTSANVEVNCTVENLEVIRGRADWPDYKLLSFDIECKAGGANDLAFPTAERIEDVVIQISAVVSSLLTRRVEHEILFSLGTCQLPEDIADHVKVCECGSEFELLLCFMTFLKQFSPEFVTGYNILGFDWGFMYNKMVNIYGMRLDGYGKANAWGTFKVQDMPHSGRGKFRNVKINGIVNFDMFSIIYQKIKLCSYKLNSVAETVLGEKKHDLSYKDLPRLFALGPEERGKIGAYCLQDSRLATKLFFKLVPHMELSAVAQLACITLTRAVFDGQQVRVFTCLLQRARKIGVVLPEKSDRFTFSAHAAGDQDDGGRSVGYQGAKVLDPDVGFHVNPVMVFDFASLYPSIIQSNNLCYSTMTHNPAAIAHLEEGTDYLRVEVQGRVFFFVREHVRRSLLAELLTDWLNMRKALRAQIPLAATEDEKVLLDMQQIAIKVICNSVYGFTGVMNGMLPCLEVAATVTAIGRDMLLKTKQYIEENWREYSNIRERFFPAMAHEGVPQYSVAVIYGDTDSVFVSFKGVPVACLVASGDAMAAEITNALFRRPVKLECEKVFTKLLMIAKKKYIGVIHTGKMMMRGVDMVRKSNCRFVNDTAKALLNLVFYDEDVATAAASSALVDVSALPRGLSKLGARVREAHAALSSPALDVRDFVMTSELSKAPKYYASSKLAHLTVYRKKIARNEEPPQVKDRIEYVIIAPGQRIQGDPFREKETDLVSSLAEDPNWVTAHKLRLNADYYFSALLQTLSVTFNAVFGDAKTAHIVMRSFIPDTLRYPAAVRKILAENTKTLTPM
ncbi:DNA polymerase [Psittacid alphaherpesvirus 1]|uniref:DNA polymerase catalytic subunit n=3 Tax=Psittacid alphaherpesvirus 1 TaxID=50294 RepID=DPOL_PSHV1|nr:DNA polymerase catalytic subunit [Psittacid alphaherpesvirus 1]Q6UDK1.1 RecName: Full=DNA polymerase catalytic subunit [Psittacid herpesvirus 1 Amazon parrot/1997]AAQ73709.1 DNA polymerase [Psittacid alphaherpesvirus 1]